MRSSVAFSSLVALATALKDSDPGPTCKEVVIPVKQENRGYTFVDGPERDNETQIVEFVRQMSEGAVFSWNDTVLVNTTFHIPATYCLPSDGVKDRNALQIIVHGLTYNKTMWQGFGYDGEKYNWHQHANAHGYATLAIDLPGHGHSREEDPFTAIQPQIAMDIILQINSGAHGGPYTDISDILGREYLYTIFVDGAYLGAAIHTDDYDFHCKILTGFSEDYNISRFLQATWGSASEVDANRFRGAPDGYLVQKNQKERISSFYAGDYNAGLALVDWVRRDTIALGEVATLPWIPTYGSYSGGVFLIAGENDSIACKPIDEGGCTKSLPQTANLTFSKTRAVNWAIPSNTGHSWSLHNSAGLVLEQVHIWIDAYLDSIWPPPPPAEV
ncbi:hypothetical protein OQA88_5079 [Cercophora sp. LCS_1]